MIEGPRPVRREELRSLVQLLNKIFRPKTWDIQDEYPHLFNEDNIENLLVVVDNGHVVAHLGIFFHDVAIYGCRFTVGCIGAVATAEEYRGQGLASKLLFDAFDRFDKADGSLILISGDRGLYLRNGCVPVSRATRFDISRSFADEHANQELSLRGFSTKEILTVSALYCQEPVRFLRPVEDYHYFLHSGMAMDHPSDLWLLQRKDQTVAYTIVQRARDSIAPGIVEYAGDRRAIIGSLSKLIDSSGSTDSLSLYVPVADKLSRWQLQDLGLTPVGKEMDACGSTVRIQNFPRFFQCMRPYLAEILGSSIVDSVRVEDSGSDITFYFGKEKLTLSRDDATALVFGTSEGKECQVLEEHKGPVAEALHELFPIPAPWYGLNFV